MAAKRAAEPDRAERVIAFIERYLRVPEGRMVGQPIVLRSWQKDVIRGIYGSPTRLAIVSFGRKNGKTSLIAMLLMAHLVGPEAQPNGQIRSAAQSRDQAAVVFSLAAKMARLSPDLTGLVRITDSAKEILGTETGAHYKALSADATTAYGLSPVMVIHDELGQVKGPRSELYEALETAVGAHAEPLSVVISTQAPTDADLLSVLIDDAKSGADPKVKLFLYTAPTGADPFSDEAMTAANPAMGDFLNAEEVRGQAAAAKRMPAREAAYRNLVLNQRVSMTNPLISQAIWARCGDEIDLEAFRGDVWCGLDLSARNDLTAFAAVAQGDDSVWNVLTRFYAPAVGVADRAHRDRVPYDVWARDGLLTLTPGSSVDYEFVAADLMTLCADWNVREVAFDRWRIDVLKSELARMGANLPLVPFGQGFRDMTPAIDSLEAALFNSQLRHGNHPILTMCAANAVATRDAAGNRKADKARATGRIDGLVALLMALGRAVVHNQAPVQAFVLL